MMDFTIQEPDEYIEMKRHQDSKKILLNEFGSEFCIQDKYEFRLIGIYNQIKNWPLRIIDLEGMESYPRAHFAKRVGDALIVIHGDQIDTVVRDGAFGRDHKETHSPGPHVIGGRMFDTGCRPKDNDGVLYIGGRVIECPISGHVTYKPCAISHKCGRFNNVSVLKINDDKYTEICKGGTASMTIYRKLTPAKSRIEAVKYNDGVEHEPYFVDHPIKKGFVLRKYKKINPMDQYLKFMDSIGLQIKKSTVPVYKRDIYKSVKRRIRRKKISPREQVFFASILGANKMAKMFE